MKYQVERRAAPRFDMLTNVRFLLHRDFEGSGKLLNISECGLALVADVDAEVGDEIVVYPDGLGRISGRVARAFEEGFAVAFTLSQTQRETMKDRISAALHGLPYFRTTEDRNSVRVRYNIETDARFEGRDEPVRCVLVDLSKTGCRVQCAEKPAVGAVVVVGALKGIVRRHTEDGFAIEFIGRSATKRRLGHEGGRRRPTRQAIA